MPFPHENITTPINMIMSLLLEKRKKLIANKKLPRVIKIPSAYFDDILLSTGP